MSIDMNTFASVDFSQLISSGSDFANAMANSLCSSMSGKLSGGLEVIESIAQNVGVGQAAAMGPHIG